MPTGLVRDDRFLLHEPGSSHPERPDRLRAVHRRLDESDLGRVLVPIAGEPTEPRWVRQVHEEGYLERLRHACQERLPYIDAVDSAICPLSGETAYLATGGVLAAADAIMEGVVENAFCAVRPPGHHAESDRSMGFCLLNHIAIAAEYLKTRHGLGRMAIVDFDVHHGNGTQHFFERRNDVLFISLHEDPRHLYPGTGFAGERGEAEGKGLTVNLPMAPGGGDADYRKAFRGQVLPELDAFRPEMLLVSAGFDAAGPDPLAHMELTAEGFRWMTQQLKQAADQWCGGRMLSTLEGGYNLDSLAECVESHVRVLAQ